MTRSEIIAAQERIGLPSAWEIMATGGETNGGGFVQHQDVTITKVTRHYLSGPTFQAELKGRISIEADEAGWIAIHTEAGPIMIRRQVLNVDGGVL